MPKQRQFRLSVVTASYNDLDGLKATWESIRIQTVPVEWIVIDGDSGAAHRTFLASVPKTHHKIVWLSEKDNGLYDAMNKGFQKSTSPIVLFLNCGDLLQDPMIVQRVLEDFDNKLWKWSVGIAVRVNQDYQPYAIWEYLNPSLGGLALGTRTFCHQATFYTREILLKVMPYDIYNLASDHLLNIRAFKISKPTMLPFVTTSFVDGGISSTRPFKASMRDLRQIRIEQNLLLGGNLFMDLILSKVVVLLVGFGSKFWSFLRLVSKLSYRTDSRLNLFPNYKNLK